MPELADKKNKGILLKLERDILFKCLNIQDEHLETTRSTDISYLDKNGISAVDSWVFLYLM